MEGIEFGLSAEAYRQINLKTTRGEVAMRHYAAPNAEAAVIYVGGVGGGFDTPAKGLYPRLCEDLVAEGIGGLRVQFRHPTILAEAVADVDAGIRFLAGEGVTKTALVGHSFGGAVVIQAALRAPAARAIVTLAAQSYGAAQANDLAGRCAILAVHGRADRVLPYSCSEHVYNIAREPKELVLYDGAGHGLEEVAGQLHDLVRGWLLERLAHKD